MARDKRRGTGMEDGTGSNAVVEDGLQSGRSL
jgi:hypothetical protein